MAAAVLVEGAGAGVADGAVGGVEGAAGLIKGPVLIHFQAQAIQGQGAPAGQGQGGGGELGQAIARGKVGIEGDRAVIQQPAAEQTAGVDIGALVLQAALHVAALVIEGSVTQAAAGLIKDPAGIQVDGGGGEGAAAQNILRRDRSCWGCQGKVAQHHHGPGRLLDRPIAVDADRRSLQFPCQAASVQEESHGAGRTCNV